ncbi:MAG TPA: polysaccharide deacetylase family protein [Sedimentisphaerales bacterium]|nr:polysaccharide deacetylase family protein [Sedimentisphaerales bacterium]
MPKAIKASIKLFSAVLYAAVSRLLQKGPSRVVLLYHGVDKAHLAGFRKQMAYLARKCAVVKPSEIMNGNTGKTKTVVALTFDDALVSFFENGLPVLKEYGLPAGVFVPTGNLGRRPGWTIYEDCLDADETVMSAQQIAALDREGIEVSSHTVSHPVLSDLDDAGLEEELGGSKRRLEEILGHEVSGISYPYGACDARVYHAAHKAGYKVGFTVEPDNVNGSTEGLRIGRFEVAPYETFLQFKLKVDGAYHVAGYLRRLKAILFRS